MKFIVFFLYRVLVLCLVHLYCHGQVCTTKPGTTFQFYPLQVKYIGCNDSTSTSFLTKSRLDCARTCHNEGNCVAFSYDKTSGLCSVCSDNSVKSLVVDKGPSETFYVLRQNIQYGQLTVTPNTTAQLNLSCGITVGNLIVLRGVYTQASGFFFQIHPNSNNQVLHFRPRDNSIVLNHIINGQWGEGVYIFPRVFPFKVGERFVVHILAGVDKYAIFVDGKFVHNYQYMLPPTAVRLMRVAGNLQLLELSV